MYRPLYGHVFSFLMDPYLGVGSGPYGKSTFNFTRNCLLMWLYYFAFPSARDETSSGPMSSSSALGLVRFLNFSHSNRCVPGIFFFFHYSVGDGGGREGG